MKLTIVPVEDLPLIHAGDNLYFNKQEDFIRRALCVRATPKPKE